MGYRVTVTNVNRAYRINEKFVEKITRKILGILRRPGIAEFEVIFLSDSLMRPINKRYRAGGASTDVLSFDLGSLGEILISSDTAFRNSKLFNTSFEEELVLYIIHGILHLFGYEDGNAKDRHRMSKRERRILNNLCKSGNLSKVLTRP